MKIKIKNDLQSRSAVGDAVLAAQIPSPAPACKPTNERVECRPFDNPPASDNQAAAA
jgi:hypothetical protein